MTLLRLIRFKHGPILNAARIAQYSEVPKQILEKPNLAIPEITKQITKQIPKQIPKEEVVVKQNISKPIEEPATPFLKTFKSAMKVHLGTLKYAAYDTLKLFTFISLCTGVGYSLACITNSDELKNFHPFEGVQIVNVADKKE